MYPRMHCAKRGGDCLVNGLHMAGVAGTKVMRKVSKRRGGASCDNLENTAEALGAHSMFVVTLRDICISGIGTGGGGGDGTNRVLHLRIQHRDRGFHMGGC